jgi:hypothetical protein
VIDEGATRSDSGLLSAALHHLGRRFVVLTLGTLVACSTSASPTAEGNPSATSNGGGSGAEPSMSGAGGAPVRPPSSLIPARVRRLANAEYDGSVQALLGTAQKPASDPDFPPDLRRDGFTVNAAQRVDAVIVERLADAADVLASEAQGNGTLTRLAPCAVGADQTACARQFVTSFGAKVYRRPLLDEEVEALLALYAVGAEGATYEDGIAHVTRGLLQSAGFLYLTELGSGEPTPDGIVQLTPYEIAASLAYFLTSSPPDDELLAKAASAALSDPAEREAQARRLFATEPRAKDTVVRLVREWLGIDRIDGSAKDSLVYPSFEQLKPSIVAESSDFVRAVAFESTGNVSELLGAHWTVSSGPLALYQPAGSGPIPGSTLLDDRVGILNQAAFLGTYALAHEGHPIFRGVAVAQRVACMGLDSPASFNIQVVPPLPDPSLTIRERYTQHSTDEICAGCHQIIDPFGFSFEHYDGMGAYRALDHGQNVDSAVVVAAERDFDGPYADSNQLAEALSQSPTVSECFERYMFRAAAGTGDGAATPGEPEYIEALRALPAETRGNIVESLIRNVKTPNFTVRSAP